MANFTISGAGPSGCLLAIYLAKRGYSVDIFERRADIRKISLTQGRSINLALSDRGLKALHKAGVLDQVMAISVPIKGRKVHLSETSSTRNYIYGRNEKEVNYSVSRHNLNQVLLAEAAKFDSVTVYCQENTSSIDFENSILTTESREVLFNNLIIADGTNSQLRQSMVKSGLASFIVKTIQHGYKELLLPKEYCKDFNPNYLHIWPRDSFMLMGLANLDGSMTMTIFMPHSGEIGLEQLNSKELIQSFFEQYIPDVLSIYPDITSKFFETPISNLITVEGKPWYYRDKVLILGDAAHAMVPFFGQGINCAFEDCRIFDELIEKEGLNKSTFECFYQDRKPDTDAITQMAAENYDEMKQHVAEKTFKYKSEIEKQLMLRYPEQYISRYVLVSYTHQPYSIVQKTGLAQQSLISKIITHFNSIEQINWDQVSQWMQEYQQHIDKLQEERKAA